MNFFIFFSNSAFFLLKETFDLWVEGSTLLLDDYFYGTSSIYLLFWLLKIGSFNISSLKSPPFSLFPLIFLKTSSLILDDWGLLLRELSFFVYRSFSCCFNLSFSFLKKVFYFKIESDLSFFMAISYFSNASLAYLSISSSLFRVAIYSFSEDFFLLKWGGVRT